MGEDNGNEVISCASTSFSATRIRQRLLDQLVRVLNLYFTHLDSQNPLHLEGLVLTDLTEAPVGLPPFSLYRDGRSVKILLPQDTGVAGLSATASVGSVTVTIG